MTTRTAAAASRRALRMAPTMADRASRTSTACRKRRIASLAYCGTTEAISPPPPTIPSPEPHAPAAPSAPPPLPCKTATCAWRDRRRQPGRSEILHNVEPNGAPSATSHPESMRDADVVCRHRSAAPRVSNTRQQPQFATLSGRTWMSGVRCNDANAPTRSRRQRRAPVPPPCCTRWLRALPAIAGSSCTARTSRRSPAAADAVALAIARAEAAATELARDPARSQCPG